MKKYKLGNLGNVCMCKRILKEQTNSISGIPFFKIGTFGGEADVFIDRETFESYKKLYNYPKKGDVLISAAGTIGRTVIFDGTESYFQDSNIVWIANDESQVLNKYLFYCYKNIKWFTSKGSTILRLYNDNIKNSEIVAPSLSEQGKIISVLSSLDDKIALNNRINAKLEQMAKRLYDYWFVQFDFPNADGKPYKSNGGKMVWNEELKREIPAGWEVKKLGDVCEIVLGGTPSTANNEFWENGTINWLNSGEVGIFPIVESEKKITEIAVEKSTTEFLKAGSVTLSITRYLRPSILAIDACINQSVVGIKENDLFKNCFLYPYLQNEIDRLMSLRTGAQQPHINKEIVEDSFINILSKELMEKYEKKVTPIYLQIINIAKETQKLTMLRDRLLPLLMNGQVEVR